MNFLNNVSVLILGLGESGLACVQFAHRYGAIVAVADTRIQPPNLAAVQLLAGVRVVLGNEFDETLLQGITQIVISPGITPVQTTTLLKAAQTQDIAVYSEIDWFGMALAELHETTAYSPTVLAITGTNGKTTVTELTTHICNESDLPAVACGNISPAALAALMVALDAQTLNKTPLPAVWVLELSSFQLHYTQGDYFNPVAAALLNITQDHLDWHTSMNEYITDKSRIFGKDTLRILNRDDATSMLYAKPSTSIALNTIKNTKSKKTIKTISSTAYTSSPLKVHTFGMNLPSNQGDVGCQMAGIQWLVHAAPNEFESENKRRKPNSTNSNISTNDTSTHIERLMPADALRLRGSHNHANALAALLLVQATGVTLAKALHGLRSYAGAPNRCELIKIINDVEYINDSKGTNVGATVAALNGLSEGRLRLILIAGGVGKGQYFSPLAAAVAQHCKAVILIGVAATELADAFAHTSVPLHYADDLNTAVTQGMALASTGDAVLLSPACSSFDMFKSYAHRAQAFVEAVQTLAIANGDI